MCDSLGIDVSKVRNYDINTEDKDLADLENTYPSVSIAISAAVTAYGSIHISKIKKDILKANGNIYYSDTDSIVTDIELEKVVADMIHPKEIGKLKREYNVGIKRLFYLR